VAEEEVAEVAEHGVEQKIISIIHNKNYNSSSINNSSLKVFEM